MEKTYQSCAETAKLLRQALKESFPGVKFSVRSSTYAGGASTGPWAYSGDAMEPFPIRDAEGRAVNTAHATNAARIVACVNACEGVSDPTIIREGFNYARAQRDELAAAAREVLDTELGEMACEGSMAPAEDALGKLRAALAKLDGGK